MGLLTQLHLFLILSTYSWLSYLIAFSLSITAHQPITSMSDLFDKWPRWITRFIGAHSYNKKPLPLWRTCIWAFLGAFVGIAIVEIIFTYSYYFRVEHHVPMIIASCVSFLFLTCHGPLPYLVLDLFL